MLCLWAGLLLCASLSLAPRPAACQTLVARAAAAGDADSRLPLSRLPATATDKVRQEAWEREREMQQLFAIKGDANARGIVCSYADSTASPVAPLRYGDTVYTEDVTYACKAFQTRSTYALTHNKAHQGWYYQASVPVGGKHRIRLIWTRTARGLHVQTTRLPDPAPRPSEKP